jgi:hypothetical protein
MSGLAKVARREFRIAFPDIDAKLIRLLTLALGDRQFQDVSNGLAAKLPYSYASQSVTRDTAREYIDKVQRHAHDEIESLVLEFLPTAKYERRPASEFTDGFRQRFQTGGTGKSQGSKVVLQVPRSWRAVPGE